LVRGGPPRLRRKKPKLPWTYEPRSKTNRIYSECGGKRIYHDQYSSAQGVQDAINKACGPRKIAREFDPGGPESGTLVGARRAPGLFDSGWGESFPLTRKEQQAYQEGTLRPDPFFAPPTTPHPSNYIEDKLQRLRGTFGPTPYQSPKGYFAFCPQGGYGISCAGPDGEVGWSGGSTPLSGLDVKRFTEAYCAAGQCQEGGRITPPPGYKEFVVKTKIRNPAVAIKASCQPVLADLPVIQDVRQLPRVGSGPAPPLDGVTKGCPPGTRWALGLTGCSCQTPATHPIALSPSELLTICGIS
jgi:hypothetical protein